MDAELRAELVNRVATAFEEFEPNARVHLILGIVEDAYDMGCDDTRRQSEDLFEAFGKGFGPSLVEAVASQQRVLDVRDDGPPPDSEEPQIVLPGLRREVGGRDGRLRREAGTQPRPYPQVGLRDRTP